MCAFVRVSVRACVRACVCHVVVTCDAGKENPEFNMRHDWNSLLSDDPSLLMKHYSKDFFPHVDTMVGLIAYQDYFTWPMRLVQGENRGHIVRGR